MEDYWDEGVFITPKVYGLKKTDKLGIKYKIKMKGMSADQREYTDEEIYNILKEKLTEKKPTEIQVKTTIFKKDLKKLQIENIIYHKTF